MFSELVVAYLFLGGVGGGACAVVAVLGLLADGEALRCAAAARFRDERGQLYGRFFGGGLAAALGALALGMVCLLADLGRPDRILLVLVAEPTSYLVVGAWSLGGCFLLAVALLALWRGLVAIGPGALRVFEALLLVASLATVTYTGLLLSSMASVPLWHSPWVPVAFVLSSVSCGIALVLLVAVLNGAAEAFESTVRLLVRADGLVVLLEAAALVLWLGTVLHTAGGGPSAVPTTATDEAALASVRCLLAGPEAMAFWLGLVGVGLLAPLVLDLAGPGANRAGRAGSANRANRAGSVGRAPSAGSAGRGPSSASALAAHASVLASAACVLVGGACLRAVVIGAGLLPAAVGLL